MREPNPDKLNELVGKLVNDLGASLAGASILLGDRLGLYKAMIDGKEVTPAELAKKTGLHERYVREWLSGQAASGYIDYHPEKNAFSLSPEQVMAFAEEGSPAFFAGAFDVAQAIYLDEPKVAEAFRSGKGVGWHEHRTCLFSRHGALLPARLQRQSGLELDPGARRRARQAEGRRKGRRRRLRPRRLDRADGQGLPELRFFGFDYHVPVDRTRPRAAPQRPASPTASRSSGQRQGLSRHGYDLVAFFDCLHDMGDPVGAAQPCHARRSSRTAPG